MQLKTLKVFCDVVSRRSFSRAADENGMSQSGASQMVHHLEDELGVKLIDRSKRPFVLTPEGEVYYEGCRKLVQRYQALEEEIRTLHEDVAGRVAVASIYSVGLSHMDRLVQQFVQKYPQANVKLEYLHPAKVYEAVEEGQVDLGLVSYPKASRTIAALPWRVERMVLVCSPQHHLAEEPSVPLAAIDGQAMVGFDDGLQIRREIDRALAAADVEPKIAMQFDNIETIKRAVEINAGVSILPEPTIVREVAEGSLVGVPLEGVKMLRPLGIIHRKGVDLGKSARRFIELLASDGDAPAASPETNGHDGAASARAKASA
jgi:DNA-binding transcriptional LysR family regulator